jgi:peroxiredoxin (alkyl hydroperoxide reductase subunit C)
MAVLVGKKAPSFSADAVVNGGEVVEGFSLEQYKGKKYVLFFFYPADFTFVCPTEILAFQERIEEFEKRNVAIVGCSVDAKNVHWAWLQTELKNGGIKGVKYPLVADASMTIADNYDVLAGSWDYNEEGEATFTGIAEAYRGLFLIDREGVVRHQLVNDMPLGRSVDEALRLIDALQYSEEYGEVCPANWKKGDRALKESHDSIASYLGDKQ